MFENIIIYKWHLNIRYYEINGALGTDFITLPQHPISPIYEKNL